MDSSHGKLEKRKEIGMCKYCDKEGVKMASPGQCTGCRARKAQEWQARNKEAVNQASRKYHKEHRDAVNAKARIKYQRDKLELMFTNLIERMKD